VKLQLGSRNTKLFGLLAGLAPFGVYRNGELAAVRKPRRWVGTPKVRLLPPRERQSLVPLELLAVGHLDRALVAPFGGDEGVVAVGIEVADAGAQRRTVGLAAAVLGVAGLRRRSGCPGSSSSA
jgi:hypothetical protein